MPWIAIKDESSTAFYYKRPSVVPEELTHTHTHTHTIHMHNLKIQLLNDLALLSSSAQCETRGRTDDKDSGYQHIITTLDTSLMAQMVKKLPAMKETWVRALGQKDPLE